MKRFFLLAFFAFCVSTAFGQTYYYKYLYHVDKDTGAKSKNQSFVKEGGCYMTFTNGQNNCYRSDKDGFKMQFGSETYRYIGSDNGRLVYYFSYRDSGNIFMQNYPKNYYYFSTDYSRLNMWSDCSDFNIGGAAQGGGVITVYERSSAPVQKSNAPDQLW